VYIYREALSQGDQCDREGFHLELLIRKVATENLGKNRKSNRTCQVMSFRELKWPNEGSLANCKAFEVSASSRELDEPILGPVQCCRSHGMEGSACLPVKLGRRGTLFGCGVR
jgi:hypothetical protein